MRMEWWRFTASALVCVHVLGETWKTFRLKGVWNAALYLQTPKKRYEECLPDKNIPKNVPGKETKTSETCFKKLRTKEIIATTCSPTKVCYEKGSLVFPSVFFMTGSSTLATDQGRNKHRIAAKTEKTPLKSKGRKHVEQKTAKEKKRNKEIHANFPCFFEPLAFVSCLISHLSCCFTEHLGAWNLNIMWALMFRPRGWGFRKKCCGESFMAGQPTPP